MGLKRLHGSQRLRCAVNILSCFPIKVSSLYLFCSFRGRNVLKEGGFVTPRPERVYGMCNHMCTKGFLNYFSAIIEFLKVFLSVKL